MEAAGLMLLAWTEILFDNGEQSSMELQSKHELFPFKKPF